MTKSCPVCMHLADRRRDPGGADKVQVRCPRCGTFELSGTALAMLGSRMTQDPLARARLSHAIRSNTSDTRMLFLSSANLDDLAQRALPGVPQQVGSLVRWLAAQLGEDRFGRVSCPPSELLAGVVGAIDGDRVSRLIDYAVKEGLIERDGGSEAIGLSPEGWVMAEPPQTKQASDQQPQAHLEPAVIEKSHCNECGGDRNAYRRASHRVSGHDEEMGEWSDSYDVLECCGCGGISVRRTLWLSELDSIENDPITGLPRLAPGTDISYWPPPTRRKKPEWASELIDAPLRTVVDEVYQALNAGLIVLASIGTRTLLDRAMYLRIGDPRGGFAEKLDQMVQKGHIGHDERRTLEIITDAGNAAAHRGFAPMPDALETIVVIVENFLHREFVLKSSVEGITSSTPPRRPRTRDD